MEQIKQINEDMKPEKDLKDALADEVEISFVRSGGRGGQNVNKVATKAQLRWNINDSKVFNEEEKKKIYQFASSSGYLLTGEGDLLINDSTTRSQNQNRQKAQEKFFNFIEKALTPQKERLATKIPKIEKVKRLLEKKKHSEKKKFRKKINHDWD